MVYVVKGWIAELNRTVLIARVTVIVENQLMESLLVAAKQGGKWEGVELDARQETIDTLCVP